MITKLKKEYPVREEYSKITAPFKVIHYDGEPILFLGYNDNNDILLCSLVDTDEYKKMDQFIEIIVDNRNLKSFFDKKITYLDMLKNSNSIFLVNVSYDRTDFKSYIIEFDDIPMSHKPSEKSFCPELLKENFFICSIKEKL